MKLFLVIAVVIGAAIGKELSEEARHKLLDYHNTCVKETGVDESLTVKAMNGEFTEDPKFKAHLVCFNKQIQFMDGSGKLQHDVIKQKLMMYVDDAAKVDEVTVKCAVEKGSPEETSFEMAKCLHQAKKDMM